MQTRHCSEAFFSRNHSCSTRRARRWMHFAAALATANLFAGSALAATDYWSGNGPTGNPATTWETATNWSLGHAPTSVDDAFFATGFNSGTFIYYQANHTIDAFYDDTATAFSLNQNGSTTGLTLTAGFLYEYGLTGMGAQSIQQVTMPVNANIALYGDNVFTIDDLRQSGGARTINNNGSGWLALQQIETTGPINANGGVLEYNYGGSSMSNSATIVANGATLQTDSDMAAPLTLAGAARAGWALGASPITWAITYRAIPFRLLPASRSLGARPSTPSSAGN